MSFLGYDPGRLAALRRRLDDLADEAAGMRLDDPVAADAADAYQRAVRLMTEWRHDVVAISSCAFDSPFRPVALGGVDVLDVLRPTDAAWTTVTDPRSGLIVSAEDHARHVAEALASGRYRLDALASAVTVAMATPAGRDVVLATLGPEQFAAVAEQLARSIARDEDEAARWILAVLAAGFGAAFRAGTLDRAAWERQLTDGTDPYATALVLERAALPTDALLRLATAAWTRWRAAPNIAIDGGVAPATQARPAVIITALAADPLAARRFVETLGEDDLWSLLTGIDVPPTVALPFLLASADSRVGPPADVERSMVAVLTFLHHRRREGLVPDELGDGLGAFVGPYLEQLLGADDVSGYPHGRWSLSEHEAATLVGGVARNKASAASLLVFVDALAVTRFAEFVAAGPVDGAALQHLGALAGRTERLVADARHDVAEEQAAAWTAVWSLLGSNVGPLARVPGGAAVNKAVGYGVNYLGDVWRRHGWVGAPPDPNELAVRQQADIVGREDSRLANLLAGMYAAGRATGAVPATTAPPPPVQPRQGYDRTSLSWRRQATDEQDADARESLWQAAMDFEAGWGRGEIAGG
jgi:hypothetical protein